MGEAIFVGAPFSTPLGWLSRPPFRAPPNLARGAPLTVSNDVCLRVCLRVGPVPGLLLAQPRPSPQRTRADQTSTLNIASGERGRWRCSGEWLGNRDWLGNDRNRVIVELKEAPFGASSASSSSAAACSAFPVLLPPVPPASALEIRFSAEPKRKPADRSRRAGAVQLPSTSSPPLSDSVRSEKMLILLIKHSLRRLFGRAKRVLARVPS